MSKQEISAILWKFQGKSTIVMVAALRQKSRSLWERPEIK